MRRDYSSVPFVRTLCAAETKTSPLPDVREVRGRGGGGARGVGLQVGLLGGSGFARTGFRFEPGHEGRFGGMLPWGRRWRRWRRFPAAGDRVGRVVGGGRLATVGGQREARRLRCRPPPGPLHRYTTAARRPGAEINSFCHFVGNNVLYYVINSTRSFY